MSLNEQNQKEANSDELKSFREKAEYSFASPDIPKIYTNGFLSGHSRSDVYVILERNGHQVAVVNMSFTTAKSLQESLAKTISSLELKTDHVIMTIDDVPIK